jgi:hypothetical protein
MIIDFDGIEVKDSNKTYLKEDGEYVVTVTEFTEGVSANKGTPYIKFELKTDDDKYCSTSLYLTSSAMWRFKKFVMALGHPGTGNIDPLVLAKSCIGKKLKVVCAHTEKLDPITNMKEISKYLEVVDYIKC